MVSGRQRRPVIGGGSVAIRKPADFKVRLSSLLSCVFFFNELHVEWAVSECMRLVCVRQSSEIRTPSLGVDSPSLGVFSQATPFNLLRLMGVACGTTLGE